MQEKKNLKQKIVVVGDVWVDNVLVPTPWQKGNKLTAFNLPGGALLIRDMMKALSHKTSNFEIISYPEKDKEKLSNQDIIISIAEGEKVKDNKIPGETYYIKKTLGYSDSGPGNGVPAFARDFTYKSSFEREFIIIAEAGKGFRDVESAWKSILENAEKSKNSVIIYNMAGPLFSGKLWEAISQKNLLNRLILIIDANDLREEGVNISRKLSWDRTIADFVTILAYKKHDDMEKCPHILVRFGLEGVIYYHLSPEKGKENQRDVQVFYIPNKNEDEIKENTPGEMKGLTSALTGFLALHMIESGKEAGVIPGAIIDAVPPAADRVIRLLEKGYKKENDRLQYPFEEVFPGNSPVLIKKIDLHQFNMGYFEKIRKEWNILSHRIPLDYHLKDIAEEYVINGKAKALENVPIARFGKLLTVDKNEIENFRSIQNLVKEYLKDNTANKPLSIAVFGPPGSGKSFAVKSVANSVLGIMGKKADVLEYNLSQFESPQDITRAFHEIRDFSLRASVPLIFFDEFDSSYNNEILGWLKYFLAPMQDGVFKEGEKTHPIGRAIFVFAGGTHRSLHEFARESKTTTNEIREDLQRFIAAKGPDFVSRLKGYVNILGPNPINRDDGQDTVLCRDRFFIIRRAVLLRALLLQQKNIVAEDGKIRIDEDVLRALLVIPKYKHGARSMAAIINMSMLSGRDRFEKAALPSPEQLRLHVDAHVFMNILDRDLIINIASIDRAIHEVYLSGQKQGNDSKIENHSSKADWDNLDEEVKQLNRMLAENIPYYLLLINCSYRPKPGKPNREDRLMEFTEEEIDYLAKMAHERWAHEMRVRGWQYGNPRDDSKKLHNCLVPWEQLPEDLKIDRGNMKAIPRILENVGFEVYRLK
ncbi:MAG: AAA family ATPase [Candidatus Aminicenantes bacterium]|nr:MAG: AAA family ATPase [Candidatus Aminicenantes bacterium]